MKYFAIYLLAFLGIIGYNVFLAHRDIKLFDKYDQVCAQFTHHPDCQYSK